MDSNKYYIPRYLDEPFRLIIFTIDELIVTLLPLFLIGLFVNELIGLLLAAAAYYFYIKLKKKETSAFFKRALYWSHGVAVNLQVLPSFSMRHFKG